MVPKSQLKCDFAYDHYVRSLLSWDDIFSRKYCVLRMRRAILLCQISRFSLDEVGRVEGLRLADQREQRHSENVGDREEVVGCSSIGALVGTSRAASATEPVAAEAISRP